VTSEQQEAKNNTTNYKTRIQGNSRNKDSQSHVTR
jgi:hypothetical protein